MRRQVLPIFFASVMLLGGCAALRPTPDTDSSARKTAQPQTAEQRRNQQILSEAGTLIRSGNTDRARTLLGGIEGRRLLPDQKAQFGLQSAQIELSGGAPEKALVLLQVVDPQYLGPEDRRTFHQSRAFAYALTDRPSAAAEERVALAPLLTDPKEQRGNQTAIFDALNQLPASVLQNGHDGDLGGWMALVLLFKQYPQNGGSLETALRQWRQRFPQHPADLTLLRNYSAKLPGRFFPLRTIAVLLPEAGPLAQAGQAVKSGLLAAERETRGDKPKLRFYNSETLPPGPLYRQAIADGASLVIGPLEKDKLKLLAEGAPLTVPVLALNDIPGLSAPNLYQFTLSPIDEAEQAAVKAWADGHRKALILVPGSERGKRIAQGYADAWRTQGGAVLKTVYYNPQTGDFTQAIEKLLSDDTSASRFRQISEIVPGVQFSPRKRDDMDVIFINADPAPARTLNRQLRNSGLGGVAVYATPHLYSNSADPTQNADLEGITFCDIPWFFSGAYQDSIDAAALQAPWKQLQSIYLRLLAMGIDAYHLSSRLPQLDKQPYHGATGNLLRLPNGYISRKLFCAKFYNGIPEPLGYADKPSDDNGATGNVEETPRPAVP